MKYFQQIFLLLFLFQLSLSSQEKETTLKLNLELVRISEQFKSNIPFRKSVDFFKKKKWDSILIYSQKLLVSSNNKSLKDYIHFLRGYSFYHKEIFKEAEKEYLKVSKDNKLYLLSRSFLGSLALEQSLYEKSIKHLREIELLDEKEFQLINKYSILHNLGLCYLHLKKFNKAEEYLDKSAKILEQKKDTLELVGTYGDLATLYYEQYKDDLAIPYFKKAYNLAKTTNDFYSRFVTTKNMAVVEENRKDYQKALNFKKEAAQWKDSLNNQNRIYEVAKKEKEFAVAAKQKEVNLLQVENKLKENERKIFLYSAIGLLLFLGIGAYFFREKVKTNKIIAAQKETLDELNTTKDKLFSIVSHDLRSSVNALKSSNKMLVDNLASKNLEALENLLNKNSAIVNGAYGLLDNLLNWALLQTEQQYFSIENQRLFMITEHVAYNYKPLLLEKELTFENSVSKKESIQADQESLKIVLRNLIDNAIKFSQPNGFIKIYSSNTIEGYTDLIIEDSGLGMSDATQVKLLDDSVLLNKKEHEDIIGTGLGIQLVKSMIKKNNGKFNIESELGKGTKMIVSLPKTNIS